MTTVEQLAWTDANQRYLLGALAPVRAALARQAGAQESDDGTGETPLEELAAGMAAPPAIERLCAAVGLSGFERSVLLLCAGVELDSAFATLCGSTPTFGLALAALPDGHWSALAPAAPLRRWRLVELHGDAVAWAPLRINERILYHLIGIAYLDEPLDGLVSGPLSAYELPPSHAVLRDAVHDLWERAGSRPAGPIVQLIGPDSGAKLAVVAAAADRVGAQAHVMRADTIPVSPSEQHELRLAWTRETLLANVALLIDCERLDAFEPVQLTAVIRFLDALPGTIFAASSRTLRDLRRPSVRLEVSRPTRDEQRQLWHRLLGDVAAGVNGALDALTVQFDLGSERLATAAAQVLTEATDADRTSERLWAACRAQTRPALDDLAQHIEPAASWEDLVLPDDELSTLRHLVDHVRQRVRVHEDWGFADRGTRGLATSALFVGTSGTGKTMAAEVISGELRLDLYRVDLSSVVSKYIGETEKNLRRVFDAADEGAVILLFDEADALFGKRSEVRDSHDRYANIEVSYLLQRMESYRGLAILTTNMRTALDGAFLRRLRFVIEFPFPGAAEREAIWRHSFPTATPTEGLNFERLARLHVSGATIRNIALNAAFIAAADESPIRMEHLLQAAQTECVKLDKPLTASETDGW